MLGLVRPTSVCATRCPVWRTGAGFDSAAATTAAAGPRAGPGPGPGSGEGEPEDPDDEEPEEDEDEDDEDCSQQRSTLRVGNSHSPSRPLLHSLTMTSSKMMTSSKILRRRMSRRMMTTSCPSSSCPSSSCPCPHDYCCQSWRDATQVPACDSLLFVLVLLLGFLLFLVGGGLGLGLAWGWTKLRLAGRGRGRLRRDQLPPNDKLRSPAHRKKRCGVRNSPCPPSLPAVDCPHWSVRA